MRKSQQRFLKSRVRISEEEGLWQKQLRTHRNSGGKEGCAVTEQWRGVPRRGKDHLNPTPVDSAACRSLVILESISGVEEQEWNTEPGEGV